MAMPLSLVERWYLDFDTVAQPLDLPDPLTPNPLQTSGKVGPAALAFACP